MTEKRKLLTEAGAQAWEAEMKAAGITVVNPEPGTGTITFLKKRQPETPTSDDDGPPV